MSFWVLPAAVVGKEPGGSSIASVIFEMGLRAYKAGEYEEALHEFRKLLLYQPGHREAIYYITLIEKIEQRRASAIDEALKVVEGQTVQAPSATAQAQSLSPSQVSPSTQPVAVAPPTVQSDEGGEVELPHVPTPSPPKRVGEIGLFVNGVEVGLTRPIIVKNGNPLIPLKDVASALYVGLLQLSPGRFQLVFPEGVTKDITVSMMDQEPMVSEQDLRDQFGLTTAFDEAHQTFSLHTAASSALQTYTVAKPAEDIQREKEEQELTRRAALPPEERGEIPEAARPSIDLIGTAAYSYRVAHGGPTDRNLVTSVSGRAYGFDVVGQSFRKDRDGTFRHDRSYLNFTRPDLFIGLFNQSLDLYPLRGQSQSFNGVKISKTWDPALTTTYLGGDIENSVAGGSGTVKYLGRFYAAQQEFVPVDWWRLRSGLLYVENEADLPEQSGTTLYPRRNLVPFAGTTLRLPEDVSVSADVARSAYRPDNNTSASVTGWDWRVASTLQKPRYTLGWTYEFVDDSYASIGNPAAYQDYQGWNLYGSYHLTDFWSVSSSLLRYGNNVDDEPGKVTQDNQALNVSTRLQLPWEHSVNVSLSDFLSNPSGPNPGSSNRTKLYRVDYSLPFLYGTRLLVNYQGTQTHQPAAADSYSNGGGGSLFKGFEGGSSVYLSEQVTKSVFNDAPDDLSLSTSLNTNYQLHPKLGLYFNSSYGREVVEKGKNTLSGATGFRLQVTPATTLTSEYRLDTYDIDKERGRFPRHWSVFVALSQSFGFVTSPTFGAIEGWVVQDLNANGKVDPGEPGIEGVTIHLENGRQTVTSAQGHFSFSRVVPVKQKVAVDLGSLPTEWAIAAPEQEITVGKRKQVKVFFPVVKASSIQGRVFIDANGDGVFQDTEEPLEGIAVVLQPGEQFRRTTEEGVFIFDHVLPGRYTLKIYRNDLPTGYELTSKEELDLLLAPGEELKDQVFTMRVLTTPTNQP